MSVKNAGFITRLVVVLYDGLLLVGVLMVAYAPLFTLLQLAPSGFAESNLGLALRGGYLGVVAFIFYGWFWTHGGQTLGMRTWRLYLINPQGKFPTWPVALWRFVLALASWALAAALLYFAQIPFWYLGIGLGFTSMLLNRGRLAWHDIFSNTRIVRMAKKPVTRFAESSQH